MDGRPRPHLHEAQWKAALVEALFARSRVSAIWANGRLYSLDEDPRSSKVWPHLFGELRKNKAAMVLGWLVEFGPEILAVTEMWVIPEDLDDAVVDRYHTVLDLGEVRKLFESGDADA